MTTYETLFGSDKLTIMRVAETSPVPTGPTEFQRNLSDFTRDVHMHRRATATFPGVFEECGEWEWDVTAFGDTAEACADAVARYLAAYPTDHWGTRFGKVSESRFGGFTAFARRYRQKDWI
jgi:hypothetical protein